MDKSRIDRINELYRKSKAEGLSEVEKMEQQILRKEYIDAIKRNLSSQLDNISIQERMVVLPILVKNTDIRKEIKDEQSAQRSDAAVKCCEH